MNALTGLAVLAVLATIGDALVLPKARTGWAFDRLDKPSTYSSCNAYPDHTQTKLFFNNCYPPSSNKVPISTTDITVTDTSGNPNYPIDVSKAIVLTAKSFNKGTTYTSIKVNVGIKKIVEWLNCQWETVETFGLLNGLDGCKIGKNCPLAPGDLVYTQTIDFAQFSGVLKFLAGKYPYQLTIKLLNNGKEIACYVVEALLKT